VPFFKIESDIRLSDDRFETVRFKFFLAESASKIPTAVFPPFDINDESTFEFCFCEYHKN